MTKTIKYFTGPMLEMMLDHSVDAPSTVPKRRAASELFTLCCLDCGIDIHNKFNYFLALKPDVQRQVAPGGKALLCGECIETRLGRRIGPDDFDQTALSTIERYLTNPEMRTFLGPLTPQAYKSLQKVYRRGPDAMSFFGISETLSLSCNRCVMYKDIPYWDKNRPSADYWALWTHRRDRYALVLMRYFDGGKSALACVLRLADSSPFRKSLPGVDTEEFIACVTSFLAAPLRSPMVSVKGNEGFRPVSEYPARHKLHLLNMHDFRGDPKNDDYRIAKRPAKGHYDPGMTVLGRPSRRTLNKLGQLVYGEDAIQL
jgi:hypothetical protein